MKPHNKLPRLDTPSHKWSSQEMHGNTTGTNPKKVSGRKYLDYIIVLQEYHCIDVDVFTACLNKAQLRLWVVFQNDTVKRMQSRAEGAAEWAGRAASCMCHSENYTHLTLLKSALTGDEREGGPKAQHSVSPLQSTSWPKSHLFWFTVASTVSVLLCSIILLNALTIRVRPEREYTLVSQL